MKLLKVELFDPKTSRPEIPEGFVAMSVFVWTKRNTDREAVYNAFYHMDGNFY